MSEIVPEPVTPEEAQDAQSNALAVSDLSYIAQLKNSFAFQRYYQRRLGEKIKAVEEKILDGNTPDSEIGKFRAVLSALKEIERMPDEDAAGCRSILGVSEDEMPAR